MNALHFSITIGAPKEKVWDTMLGRDSYRAWTEVFARGSYYIGEWSKGSKMQFLCPGEKGEMGMIGRIRENERYRHVSIEVTGLVQNGKEDTSSESAKAWAGALENYTFKEKNGFTEVSIDLVSNVEVEEMLQTAWPKALQKLKELAEK